MRVNRWRRVPAAYLGLFFFAVAAAPHRHLNGLEDLLLDQASNSGLIAQATIERPIVDPVLLPVQYVQDSPCLACFSRDFIASLAAAIAFVPRLTALPAPPACGAIARPELVPGETSSRSPPSSA